MKLKVKGKIPNITNFATTSVLTVVENKIPSVRNLLRHKIFYLTLKRANLASKSDIAYFVSKTDFNNQLKHVTSNKN